MARFSETITLRREEFSQDDSGFVTSSNEDSEVFFNRFSLGAEARLAGASGGLKGVVEGQVRTCDYGGQQTAVVGGSEYTVENVSDQGELTVLTMRRRLSDA